MDKEITTLLKRCFKNDETKKSEFMNSPHGLLGGETPNFIISNGNEQKVINVLNHEAIRWLRNHHNPKNRKGRIG